MTVDEFRSDQEQAQKLLGEAIKATISDERRQLYTDLSRRMSAAGETFSDVVQLRNAAAAERDKLFSEGDALTTATTAMVTAALTCNNSAVLAQARDLERSVLLVRIAAWRFLATFEPKGPALFTERLATARAAIALLGKNPDAALVAPSLGVVGSALSAYGATFTNVSGGSLGATELFDKTMRPQFIKILVVGGQIQNSLNATLAETQKATSGIMSRTRTLQTMIAAASLLLGLVLAYLLGRSIVVPITTMTRSMRKLADGDKAVEIPAHDAKDEVGEMARAVEIFKQGMIEASRNAAQQAAARAGRDRAPSRGVATGVAEQD